MFWVFLMIGIMVWAVPVVISRFDNRRKTRYAQGLFINNFVDSRALFVVRFQDVPSFGVITQIDVTKAYALIMEKLDHEIVDVYRCNVYDHNAHSCYFTITIIELTNKRVIELGNGYAEVLHSRNHFDWTRALLRDLAACKAETEMVETKAPTVVGFARAMQMN